MTFDIKGGGCNKDCFHFFKTEALWYKGMFRAAQASKIHVLNEN